MTSQTTDEAVEKGLPAADSSPSPKSRGEAKAAHSRTDKKSIRSQADNDDGEPSPAPKRKKPLSFYLCVVGILILEFIYSLDATSLAVAVPAITEQLGGTTLQAFWASISYLLAVVVVQPLYSTVSDAFGRKSPLFVACGLFAVGSIVFATAKNMTAVIIGRVLQGLGGGGTNVLGEIVLTDMTTLQERPLYGGIMALPTALGSVLGPAVGALFSDFVTWRWIGWVNLPMLGAASLLLVFHLRLKSLGTNFSNKINSLDWLGMLLFTVGCTAFVIPLSWAGVLYPWKSWQTLLPLLIGIVLLALFAIYESRPVAPLMPHCIFRSRTANLTLFVSFLHGMSLFPLLLYLPLFYEAIMLDTRMQSALSLLPTSAVSVMSAIISVVAVGKGYRPAIWLCWVCIAFGAGLLVLLNQSTTPDKYRGIPVILGFGVGGLLRLHQLPMQASLQNIDDTGRAVSVLMTFRTLGGVVGLAVDSNIFSSVFSRYIGAIQGSPNAAQLPDQASEAVAFIPQLITLHLSPDSLKTVQNAYLASLHAIFYAMTAVGVPGLLGSLFIEELSLQKFDLGRQRYGD